MNYTNVPDIISTKDLDYLQDAFNWLYGACKNSEDARNNINDKKLNKVLEKSTKMFYQYMNEILIILKGGVNENSK
jgi:hypothetical protein